MTRQLYFGCPTEGSTAISTAEMLRQAANRIATKGWNQGDFYGEGGGACALGAILDASNNHLMDRAEFDQALELFIETFKELNPNVADINTIPDINDHPSVTAKQVQLAFEKAAMKLEDAKK